VSPKMKRRTQFSTDSSLEAVEPSVFCNFWDLTLGPRPHIPRNLITNRCSCFSISRLWRAMAVNRCKTSTMWCWKGKEKKHISHSRELKK
jgi:hypothetical protein